jgi:hypothetical protein
MAIYLASGVVSRKLKNRTISYLLTDVHNIGVNILLAPDKIIRRVFVSHKLARHLNRMEVIKNEIFFSDRNKPEKSG